MSASPGQPHNLFERLQRGENGAFLLLYENYYEQTAAFVRANSGSEQDARDVFQDAVLVLFKKSRNPEFRLTTDPGGFLYAVMRNLWLYRLRAQQAHPEVGIVENTLPADLSVDDLEMQFQEQALAERSEVVQKLLQTLKTECQQLIQYAFYHRLSTAGIAALLGYSESFIKVKKHRCMEALREKVKKHPSFNHE